MNSRRASRKVTVLLVFSFSLTAFQAQVYADIKKQTAEEYRLQGYEEQQKGNLTKALSFYLKSAQLTPQEAGILNDIGVIYEQMGVSEKAEEYYRNALQADEKYLPAYLNLAYLYKDKGDIAQATEYFKKRVSLGDPNDFWTQKAQKELARINPPLETKVSKEMIMDQAVRLNEELKSRRLQEENQKLTRTMMDAERHYTQGLQLAQEKKYHQAIAQFDQALSITPNNPKILRAREKAVWDQTQEEVQARSQDALKMLNLGDTVAAKQEFRKILTIIPDEPVQISK